MKKAFGCLRRFSQYHMTVHNYAPGAEARRIADIQQALEDGLAFGRIAEQVGGPSLALACLSISATLDAIKTHIKDGIPTELPTSILQELGLTLLSTNLHNLVCRLTDQALTFGDTRGFLEYWVSEIRGVWPGVCTGSLCRVSCPCLHHPLLACTRVDRALSRLSKVAGASWSRCALYPLLLTAAG